MEDATEKITALVSDVNNQIDPVLSPMTELLPEKYFRKSEIEQKVASEVLARFRIVSQHVAELSKSLTEEVLTFAREKQIEIEAIYTDGYDEERKKHEGKHTPKAKLQLCVTTQATPRFSNRLNPLRKIFITA